MNKKNLGILYLFLVAVSSFSGLCAKSRDQLIKEQSSSLERYLQDIDKKHRDMILRDFKQEIVSYENIELSQLTSYIEQIKLSVVSTYVRTKAEAKVRKFCFDPLVIQNFADAWHDQCLNALTENQSISHLLGEPLERAAIQQCGVSTSDKLYHQVKIQESYDAQPYQPKPSAPYYNAPQQRQPIYHAHSAHDKQRIIYATKEFQSMLPALSKGGMSGCNQKRMEMFFNASVQRNNSIPVIPPLPHFKNASLALLEHELIALEAKLSKEIKINPIDLKRAIETTRKELSAKINEWTPQSSDKFERMLHDLEDTIITNAGVACSLCYQTYKEDDVFGSAEKVTLISHHGKPCHSICKACAKNGALNSCPECRVIIDQQDLRRQAQQPECSANWR